MVSEPTPKVQKVLPVPEATAGSYAQLHESSGLIFTQDPEPRDLSVQSNQFPSHDRSVLPSQQPPSVAALPKNSVFQRMPSGEIPDWSPVLTANVPARRVPKYHPYAVYRCVSRGSVLRPSPDPRLALAALMRQQRAALHSKVSEVNNWTLHWISRITALKTLKCLKKLFRIYK